MGQTNTQFHAHWVPPEISDGNGLKSVEDIDKERDAELQVFGSILGGARVLQLLPQSCRLSRGRAR